MNDLFYDEGNLSVRPLKLLKFNVFEIIIMSCIPRNGPFFRRNGSCLKVDYFQLVLKNNNKLIKMDQSTSSP